MLATKCSQKRRWCFRDVWMNKQMPEGFFIYLLRCFVCLGDARLAIEQNEHQKSQNSTKCRRRANELISRIVKSQRVLQEKCDNSDVDFAPSAISWTSTYEFRFILRLCLICVCASTLAYLFVLALRRFGGRIWSAPRRRNTELNVLLLSLWFDQILIIAVTASNSGMSINIKWFGNRILGAVPVAAINHTRSAWCTQPHFAWIRC